MVRGPYSNATLPERGTKELSIALRSPRGVLIKVSEEKASRLLNLGYERADKPATPKRKPGRPRKTEVSEDGTSDS